jgi:parvulin-like peptidyl-prolyl isomerase
MLHVNHEAIEDATIRAEEAALRPRLREAMPDEPASGIEARVREWSRENVIERILLRQAVDADPALLDPASSTLSPEEQFQARVDRLVERHAGRIAQPRNKDVVEYFRKNRERFVIPELVQAAHIIKNVNETSPEADAQTAIQAIAEELRNGANFEEVADRASDCPGNGGSLGWFPRGQMVVEFDAVAFNLPAGSISPVFRTPFGFHIAKVYEHTEERPAELEEVRSRIEQHLLSEKRQKALERLLDHLRARAVIADA